MSGLDRRDLHASPRVIHRPRGSAGTVPRTVRPGAPGRRHTRQGPARRDGAFSPGIAGSYSETARYPLTREPRHGRQRAIEAGRFSSSYRAEENRQNRRQRHCRGKHAKNCRRRRGAFKRRRGPPRTGSLGLTCPKVFQRTGGDFRQLRPVIRQIGSLRLLAEMQKPAIGALFCDC